MKFVDELKALNLQTGSFAITGSGPLAVRGLSDPTDLDVIVRAPVWDDLAEKYSAAVTDTHLRIGDIDIWKNCPYLEEKTDEMIGSAEIIAGLPFVLLAYTLEWKRGMGRPKDIEDVKRIESYLANSH